MSELPIWARDWLRFTITFFVACFADGIVAGVLHRPLAPQSAWMVLAGLYVVLRALREERP